jgi:chemotaxis protein CheX
VTTRDALEGLVEDVFDDLVGLQVVPSEAPGVRPFVSAFVALSGRWTGTLLVGCSQALGRQISASMFGLDDRPPTDDEVVDAMGEVANIIGGGYKSSMEQPCTMSLPIVAMGESYRLGVPSGKTLHELHLRCAGEALVVSVVEPSASGHEDPHSR